ncbi:hypothetical protein BC567DRAFT_235443 [Phyllosticta citribraziliensis]
MPVISTSLTDSSLGTPSIVSTMQSSSNWTLPILSTRSGAGSSSASSSMWQTTSTLSASSTPPSSPVQSQIVSNTSTFSFSSFPGPSVTGLSDVSASLGIETSSILPSGSSMLSPLSSLSRTSVLSSPAPFSNASVSNSLATHSPNDTNISASSTPISAPVVISQPSFTGSSGVLSSFSLTALPGNTSASSSLLTDTLEIATTRLSQPSAGNSTSASPSGVSSVEQSISTSLSHTDPLTAPSSPGIVSHSQSSPTTNSTETLRSSALVSSSPISSSSVPVVSISSLFVDSYSLVLPPHSSGPVAGSESSDGGVSACNTRPITKVETVWVAPVHTVVPRFRFP